MYLQKAFYTENAVVMVYLCCPTLHTYPWAGQQAKCGVTCKEAYRLSRMFVVIRLTFNVC